MKAIITLLVLGVVFLNSGLTFANTTDDEIFNIEKRNCENKVSSSSSKL